MKDHNHKFYTHLYQQEYSQVWYPYATYSHYEECKVHLAPISKDLLPLIHLVAFFSLEVAWGHPICSTQ